MPIEKSIYDVEMPVIVPGAYGNCTIEYSEGKGYILRHRGIQWMGTDKEFSAPKDTFYSQYDLAYGDVLLTGLGFGILAKALTQKTSVTSVTVVELYKEVIDAFMAHNELDPKITIIEADASTYSSDRKYDCLLPDHYELQGVDWVVADMRDIAKRINHDLYWPWSIEEIFFMKMYPKQQYPLSSSALFETHKEDIPNKWGQFIKESLESPKNFPKLSNEKLLEYLEKHAIYYYDSQINKTDWGL